jgi:hypothetical protein
METVRMVLEEAPVPPHDLNPAVARRLEAICLRCLAKEPANRYQSAAKFAADLPRCLLAEPVASRSVLPGPHGWVWAGAVLVALAILAVAIITTRRPQAVPHPPMSSVVRREIFIPRPSPATPAAKAKGASAVVRQAKPAPIPTAIPASLAPVAVSVSPDRGVGYRQEFTFRYSHPLGAAAIRAAEVSFRDPETVGSRRCAISIEPNEGRVRLQFYPDRAPGLTVSGALGALTELENSVCSVDTSRVSVTRQGNDIEVRLSVAFKPSFEGPKAIESWPWDKSESRGESHVHGQWVVGNKPAAPL